MLSKTSRISVEEDQRNWYRIKSLELVLNTVKTIKIVLKKTCGISFELNQ